MSAGKFSNLRRFAAIHRERWTSLSTLIYERHRWYLMPLLKWPDSRSSGPKGQGVSHASSDKGSSGSALNSAAAMIATVHLASALQQL